MAGAFGYYEGIDLAGLVAPGGLLVLSGILASQAYQVIAALRAQGLTLTGPYYNFRALQRGG